MIPTTSSAASGRSIQTESRDQLCARAVREVEESRRLLADLEARLETAREQLRVAAEKDALQVERAELQRERIAALADQVRLHERMLDLAREALARAEREEARLRAERDRARSRNKLWAIAGFIAGGAIVLVAGR